MNTTGRERVESAFTAEGAPEIGVVICYEYIYARDHWDELCSYPWWYSQAPDVERQIAWRRDVVRKTGQDWFHVAGCRSRAERESLFLEERDGEAYLEDRRTGKAERLVRPQVGGWHPSTGPHSTRPAHPPRTREEVDLAMGPVPAWDPEDMLTDGRADLAQQMVREFGQELYPVGGVGSPLWDCYYLWGFEDMMEMVALQPNLVAYVCQRYLQKAMHSVRCSAVLGAKAIWVEECLTDTISPAAFEALNVPVLRELVDGIRRAGMKSIYYYCGDPNDRWDLLLAAEPDALALEESKKGFVSDIEEAARRSQGRCVLLGNLDAMGLLPNATEDDLRAEIARQLRAGRANGSRFIMSIGSPVTPETPVERVRRYCDLSRELGARLR
ncbi:MAG: uroporphyrinogen decarboxylase family protein [Planctomycetota bacterium]|jgi:hypothetical protein